MASHFKENLRCPVCQDVFTDPVLLSCSHSFCQACLQRWWAEEQIDCCPVCRTPSGVFPTPNLALKKLCESYLEDQRCLAASEAFCSLHAEKLKLFCLDHQQPVCLVCRDSERHANHRFRPADEAAQLLREELRKALKPLQDRLKVFNKLQMTFHQTADHIKERARHTERQIKEQFKMLHHFLQEEEEARLAALREEEEQKSQMLKEKMEALGREMAALSDTVMATEKELGAANVSFLLNHKAAGERVHQRTLVDGPQPDSRALIDEAKHLGNLSFSVWSKMREMVSYTLVILDPNTANPQLHLSEDLRTVSRGQRQFLPESPDRLEFSCSVLGSEGFHSGTHSWDVEVGDNRKWSLGLLVKSVERDGDRRLGTWRIEFDEGNYKAYYSAPFSSTHLPVKTNARRVRVHLDVDRGQLSFSDPESDTLIHTFTHTFRGTLFPYISVLDTLPLKILPQTLHVTAQPGDDIWTSSLDFVL
ncbi:hypothetical protein LDENG_00110690 [Lucifuga dentata]|nr:hypothetical protein LDENG_00110690 [Lucifuga dentata]